MRILILTQKVDKTDPILGFFYRWIEEFSKNFEKVTVICLERGQHSLIPGVRVLSLGKEEGKSIFKYVFRFYRYIWQERSNYDTVFVHMNQEYVILGWKFWKLLGKKIYLWRNFPYGTIFTRLAVILSNKVFCTSPQSYTAQFKKTEIMPVGIDTDFFQPNPRIYREPNSFLFLGRIAPIKRVAEFVDWFNSLGVEAKATIVGSALPEDKSYEELIKSRASSRIKFIDAVSQQDVPNLYQSHGTYVNFTPSGSMDKTILEAAACGTSVIVENEALKMLEGKDGEELRDFVVENHSLKILMEKLRWSFENA